MPACTICYVRDSDNSSSYVAHYLYACALSVAFRMYNSENRVRSQGTGSRSILASVTRITDDFKVWSQAHGGFWPVTNCDPGRSRHYSVNGSDRPCSGSDFHDKFDRANIFQENLDDVTYGAACRISSAATTTCSSLFLNV